MILLSIFFGAKAFALTLESHCQTISLKSEKAEVSSIKPENCVGNKIQKKSEVIFYTPSEKKNEYVVLKRKMSDTFFCKMEFDYLGLYDAEKGSEKKTWNSKDAFTSMVRITNVGGVIRRDDGESKAKNQNLCKGFPSFFRAKIVPGNVMSDSLTTMKNGGYFLMSSRFSSLYFFGRDLKKVEFVFHFPGEVKVIDAVIRKSGDLIVLTGPGNDSIDDKKDYCIDRWDLITGTLLKSKCELKKYSQQLLIDSAKLTRAFIENGTLYFEEYNENFESKVFQVAKGVQDFNLNAAFVYEN